jgi:tetratricopeptide (TPR) repeat protein
LSFLGKIFGLEKNPNYERGIKYFNEGKYELAVEALEQVVAKAGHNDPVYALGMFYAAESHAHIGAAKLHAGDLEGAREHYETALKENPTYPDLSYRLGVIHHRLGNPDRAVENLRSAIELNSGYFEAICYLGIVLFEKGDREKADELFKKALEIGATSPSPISKLLSDHIHGRETEIPPLSDLKRLVQTDAEFDLLLKQGLEAFNTGSYDLAAEFFGEAAAVHPEYADVRFKLGLSHLRRGDHQAARREFGEALRINARYTEARFYLGISFLDTREYRRAREAFEAAVADKPDYADLQCFLGATCFYLGELERAKNVLERALELSPGYKNAQYYYGLLLYTIGEHREAVEYLSSAINEGEERGAGGLSLALIHLREGNLEQAMTILRDIREAGKESADVLYFIGEVHLRMRNLEEAETYFRQAIEVNPGFLRAREKVALIRIRGGDYRGAEEVLGSPAVQFADLYKIMGDIKFFGSDLDAAEQCYRKSLKVNAEYIEASLSLALVLRKRDAFEEAETVLQKVLELDPENIVARNLLGRGPLDLEPI